MSTALVTLTSRCHWSGCTGLAIPGRFTYRHPGDYQGDVLHCPTHHGMARVRDWYPDDPMGNWECADVYCGAPADLDAGLYRAACGCRSGLVERATGRRLGRAKPWRAMEIHIPGQRSAVYDEARGRYVEFHPEHVTEHAL